MLRRPTPTARILYLLAAICSGLTLWRSGGVVWEVSAGLGAVILIAITRANGKRRVEQETVSAKDDQAAL
jgi:hypothetical protein